MKKDIFRIIICIIIFIISYFVEFNLDWINRLLFIFAYLIIGYEVIFEAIKNIIHGDFFDENFLMTIATVGAIAIGEYHEAIAVMLFFEIGEILEDIAVDKSKDSITSLVKMKPEFANLFSENEILKKSPEEIEIGQIIIVNPGEKVPLDGVIIDGKSNLDVSMLTGESIPISVSEQNEIFSGAINISGVLKIRVTKKYQESTVNKIIDLVQNATEKKARTENFITKFSKVYTPIVVVLALIVAIVPPLVSKNAFWTDWIYRALTFLVVSCPCALVISVPLSFFGGIGGASRKGILIKGGNYLETLSRTNEVVFDKTGTLTKGVFEVQEISPVNLSKDDLIKMAAYAENHSNHPIAISIKNKYGKPIDHNQISEIEEIPGIGINCLVDGRKVCIGNEKLLDKLNIKKSNLDDKIGTIVYIVIDRKYEGYILISDEIKEESNSVIATLKKEGIKATMLTGDNKLVSQKVAEKIGIEEYKSELLPEDKVSEIAKKIEIKNANETIVFVGDGVNDSPVIVTADVGIAMGGIGSDAAIEAADIVIMDDDISKIPLSIKIARKTLKVVKQNVAFALIIKCLVLLLTVLGISNMWEAVFADVGVTLIAIISSLRTLR